MQSIRRWFLLLLCVALGGLVGCSRHKEITSLQRKQAASDFSEAEFAINLRDYARAEGLLTQVVAACPDTPEYWLNLGSVRRRLGNRDGAKAAYEQMLDLVRDIYRHDKTDPGPLLQQIYVLALLGRINDARAVLEQAQKDHPDDSNVRAFVEGRQLERMQTDPTFKASAL